MTEFEKGYEQGYKDGVAGAALPNVNDNGDKIDGYSYAYKTDSIGEPYIHIDSVRNMLKELKIENKELKRYLREAITGFRKLGKALNDEAECDGDCVNCPLNNGGNCYKWRLESEVLFMIGDKDNG
jgi:hypothetical protein